MITIEKPLVLPDTYPLSRIGALTDILFFDIETTGLSGDSSMLYLIGCVFYRKKSWNLIQWFADTPSSEKEILCSFFDFLKQFKFLLHFNGDSFDIPYLLKRCHFFGLNFDFSQIESIDMYKRIKPFKKLLSLENLKQKTIEALLGIRRQDLFTGGQLIEVYRDYLATGDSDLYHLLILHNEDDLKGMPSILPILNYLDFLNFPFIPDSWEVKTFYDAFDHEEKTLCLRYKSEVFLPSPIEAECEPFSLEAEDNRLTLRISLAEGEMKHFYSNYKDYYYLIYEDTAIHKSVGEYVERTARKKATAKTCYTRTKGIFLPQPSPVFGNFLKKEYSDKLTYVPYNEELGKYLAEQTGFFDKNSEEKKEETPRHYLQSVLSLFFPFFYGKNP